MLGAGHGPAVGLERVIEPGAVLVLATDGLLERPDRPMDDGLQRLGAIALEHHRDPERLCDAALEELGAGAADDIALLVVRVA
jgi:serine phosphatase RsbU (regulator of sigma subunit)